MIIINNPASELKTDKFTLSSSEILNMNGTPVVLLPAPGIGKAYSIIDILCRYNFLSAAYAGNTTLSFRFTNAGQNVATNPNLLGSPTSRFGSIGEVGYAAGSSQYLENTSFEVFVPTGNPTTGSGTLDIYLTYKIIVL